MIVGLGNPGEKYEGTRHNVGFMVVERIANVISNNEFLISKQSLSTKFQFNRKIQAELFRADGLMLVKPMMYMNRSGDVVRRLLDYYADKFGILNSKLGFLTVVHDDLDIQLGNYKIQFGKGPKVHNGVNSIERVLRTSEFWRVRVGIEGRGSRVEGRGESGREYVLGGFGQDEREVIEGVVEEVVQKLMNHEV